MKKLQFIFTVSLLSFFSFCTFASTNADNNLNLTQTKNNVQQKKSSHSSDSRSWYVSWGYNKDFWSNSDIHISQPGLNNNFTVNNVSAGDDPEWTSGLFDKSLMGPQYNIRVGHYFTPAHTWGWEISFDHAKYNTNLNQIKNVSGVVNGQPINENKLLTQQYFYYALHNGANLLMVNLVRRAALINFPSTHLQLAAIGKVGGGVMLPHPENTIMGNTVDVGSKTLSNAFGIHHGWWQFGGWTAGVEVGAQLLFHRRVYIELTDKEAVISLSNIQVYNGTASQNLWLNEVIGNLGVMF